MASAIAACWARRERAPAHAAEAAAAEEAQLRRWS